MLLVSLTTLLTVSLTYAQYDSSRIRESNRNLEQRLRTRSDKQRSGAWALLGTGIVLNAVSLTVRPNESDGFSTGFDKLFLQAGLIVVGTGAMLGSIPLFIASSRNKRKANLLVNANRIEVTPGLQSSSWQVQTGVAIHF